MDFEDYLEEGESVNINQQRLMMKPAVPLHAAVVAAVFMSMKPTTLRSVTLFYRGTEFLE